jgi:BlaI family transcriptional regulator, penicillinase repressor
VELNDRHVDFKSADFCTQRHPRDQRMANDGDNEKASGSTPSGASGKYPKTMNLEVSSLLLNFCLQKCYKTSHVTKGHSMKRSLPPLGDLEHELLTILWAQGEMTALAVRKQVARKLKDPTIRTVLRRLEEKGYVTHSVVSGTFIYRAKESAETTAATAVQGIIERFCGGSLERVLLGLVDSGFVDPSQLAVLAGKLKRKPR